MNSLLLSSLQLVELTDVEQPSAQIRWLMDRGWKFEVGRSGRPKVLLAEAERHMLSGGSARPARQLNLAALNA